MRSVCTLAYRVLSRSSSRFDWINDGAWVALLQAAVQELGEENQDLVRKINEVSTRSVLRHCVVLTVHGLYLSFAAVAEACVYVCVFFFFLGGGGFFLF